MACGWLLAATLMTALPAPAETPEKSAPPPLIAAPEKPPERRSTPVLQGGEIHQPATVEEHEGRVRITGSAQNAQVDCAGRVAEVDGQYLVVDLKGLCSMLKVTGNANVIRVHGVAGIDVRGDDNAVTWTTYPGDATGKKSPHVVNVGAHNQIVPGE